MTVEQARNWYVGFGKQTADAQRICRRVGPCSTCASDWLTVDAASIAYDLAVARESDDRIRATVAW